MAETPETNETESDLLGDRPKLENTPDDIAQLMAEQALAAAEGSVAELDSEIAAEPEVPSPDDITASASEPTGDEASLTDIDLLGDVDLYVTIELGRTRMLLEDVLRLTEGSVVELDKLAGDPVDVYVNNCLIARGEVLVLNDNFCIRISEIVENLEEHAEDAALEQLQVS